MDIRLESLADQAYTLLRQEVTEGRIRPGSRIVENDLIEQLGISRTPIREALLKLEAEGVVARNRRRSYNVRILTVADVKEIYEILGILEGAAASFSSRTITANDCDLLEQYNSRMKCEAARGNLQAFGRWNREFHEVFLSRFPNRTLRELCNSIRRQLYTFPVRGGSLKAWLEKSVREHAEIIRLTRDKDSKRLGAYFINVHWSYEKNLRFIEDAFDPAGSAPMPL